MSIFSDGSNGAASMSETMLHRALLQYSPVLVGNSCSMCWNLSGRQISNVETTFSRSKSGLCSNESNGSLSEEGADPHAVSTESVLSAAGTSISNIDDAITISFPRFGECMTFEMVSEGFERLTGYSQSELVGQSLRSLICTAEEEIRDRMALNISVQTGACSVTDMCFQTKSGEFRACRVLSRGLSIAFDPESGRRLWILLAIYVDVSEDSEEQAAHADGLLSSLSSQVADKISNTFASMQSMMMHGEMTLPHGSWQLLPSCPWQVANVQRTFTATETEAFGNDVDTNPRIPCKDTKSRLMARTCGDLPMLSFDDC